MNLKFSKWFFLLLIVLLPIVRPFSFFYSGLLISYADIIFIVSFFFWIAALLRRETKIKYDKFYLFVGFYALAFTVSTIFADNPFQSLLKLSGEFYLFLLAVLTINLAQEQKFIKQIVFAWLSGTGITVLGSILGFSLFYLGFNLETGGNYFLSRLGTVPPGNYPRVHSFFADANMMCNFLNVSLLLALLADKMGWVKETLSKLLRFGIWFAAFFTLSPGLGGIVLSTAVWYFVLFRDAGKLVLSKIVLLAGISFAAFLLAIATISLDTSNTDQDFLLPLTNITLESSVRVLVWQNSVNKSLENPFFGKGTGADVALVRYKTLAGTNHILMDGHNILLNIFGQTGLFGLIAFVCLVAHLISRLRFTSGHNHTLLALSCAFLGAFLYQGLTGSFEDARHLWVVIGLIIVISTEMRHPAGKGRAGG
ncbi:MAG: O-antigen ligase family protein [Acidobacteriota bacterium]|nr:O-antigen ligase family protein [Acidobacteriota bacterium]